MKKVRNHVPRVRTALAKMGMPLFVLGHFSRVKRRSGQVIMGDPYFYRLYCTKYAVNDLPL